MSHGEKLASRIRAILAKRDDVVEKKMFGGLCFMVAGAMCCGITKTDFMVRVGPARFDEALKSPHARPMDFTGRPSHAAVYVAREGIRTRASLESWVRRGVAFATESESATRAKLTRKRSKAEKGANSADRRVGPKSQR
jgi:TfoX/Sxy family transcriptional regulator of competence genes